MLIDTIDHSCCVCDGSNSRVIAACRDFEYDTCENAFEYVECGDCRHVYLKNVPVASALPIIYPPNYMNYDKNKHRQLVFKIKSFLDYQQLSEFRSLITRYPVTVLDVGCADGKTLDICKRVFGEGAVLEGIEISEEISALGRAKGYHIMSGNIEHVELKENYYDLIIMQQVIEHVYDPKGVLEKLYRSLRPNGYLAIETPTRDCFDRKLFRNRYWGGYHAPRHFNIFNETSLKQIAGKIDFAVIRASYKPQPPHWIWSLHHYFIDRKLNGLAGFFTIGNFIATGIFTCVELVQFLFTKRMSNMRLLLQKAP